MSNNTPSNIQCYIYFLKRKKKLVQLCVVADGLRHHVLKASAHSDLPPLATLHEVSLAKKPTLVMLSMQVLHIPVLILACEGDPNHPVSTATALSNMRCSIKTVQTNNSNIFLKCWNQT